MAPNAIPRLANIIIVLKAYTALDLDVFADSAKRLPDGADAEDGAPKQQSEDSGRVRNKPDAALIVWRDVAAQIVRAHPGM